MLSCVVKKIAMRKIFRSKTFQFSGAQFAFSKHGEAKSTSVWNFSVVQCNCCVRNKRYCIRE